MNIAKAGLILILGVVIAGCGRSKPPLLYLLTPLPCQTLQKEPSFSHLNIDVASVHIPEYLQKPEIALHCSSHQVKLAENHHWAESLKENITRVLQTNLSALLPGAIVQTSPSFRKPIPNYSLQVIISQFDADALHNSVFRAEYMIFHNNEIVKKEHICYRKTLPAVTPLMIVITMNDNLKRLTKEIAQAFKSLAASKLK